MPDKQDMLLACVMGDAGEQYGLMILRRPHAAKSFLALTSEDGQGDDATETMDMLGFSMSVFGEMNPESQAFYRKAGIHPRHNEQVPEFLVKPPNRLVRLPNDEELILLTGILKAVVAVDRHKLLQPAELDDPAGICVITLGEDREDASPSVAREQLPQPAVISQPDAFIVSDMDISGLDLLDST